MLYTYNYYSTNDILVHLIMLSMTTNVKLINFICTPHNFLSNALTHIHTSTFTG